MKDQASNLRMLANANRERYSSPSGGLPNLIVLVSGKGGVGKSFLSLHLARELRETGNRVLLIDANLQNPALHVLTNFDPDYPLSFWIKENYPFDERAVLALDEDLHLIANSAPGNNRYDPFMENPHLFLELLTPLARRYNFVIMDTQTGLNDWNLGLLQNAEVGLTVSITDPTSVIDTYVFIKAALPYLERPNLKLVLNQVLGMSNGSEAHNNLNLALQHFLDYQIELAGLIPFDMEVKRAGLEQKPLWHFSGRSDARRQLSKLAGLLVKEYRYDFSKHQPLYQEANI